MRNLFKITAVLCALLCLTGVASVFAAAAEDDAAQTALNGEDIAAVEEQVAGVLVDAEDGSVVTVRSDPAATYDTNGDGTVTPLEIAAVLSKYIFATPDSLGGYADEIAAASQYTVTVTKDGVTTVYVTVPVEDYPQLFNAGVFQDAVDKIYAKQSEYSGDDVSLMSYEHIAGELALHAALYAATYLLGGDREDNVFHSYYESAKDADLNIDEARVSSSFINFIGKIVTFFAKLFRALNILNGVDLPTLDFHDFAA